MSPRIPMERRASSCSKPRTIELTNTTAETNLNYGIWLRQTSVSDVTNSKTESNGNIGLYVGCSAIGPTSSGCGGGPSPGNYIFTGNIAGEHQLWCRAGYRRQKLDRHQPGIERRHAQFEGRPVRREFELRQQQMVRQRFDRDQQPGRRLHQMTKTQEGARTREGSGCTMTELISNRELTGHPEVPNTMRGFRDEKNQFADPAGSAGGGNYRGDVCRPAGARAVDTRRRSEGSGNPIAQDRNQPARAPGRHARRT